MYSLVCIYLNIFLPLYYTCHKQEEKKMCAGATIVQIIFHSYTIYFPLHTHTQHTHTRRRIIVAASTLTSSPESDRTTIGHEASSLVLHETGDTSQPPPPPPSSSGWTCHGDDEAVWPTTKTSRASVSSIIRGGTSPPARVPDRYYNTTTRNDRELPGRRRGWRLTPYSSLRGRERGRGEKSAAKILTPYYLPR